MCFTCLTNPRVTRDEHEDCERTMCRGETIRESVERLLDVETEIDGCDMLESQTEMLIEYVEMMFSATKSTSTLSDTQLWELIGFTKGFRYATAT